VCKDEDGAARGQFSSAPFFRRLEPRQCVFFADVGLITNMFSNCQYYMCRETHTLSHANSCFGAHLDFQAADRRNCFLHCDVALYRMIVLISIATLCNRSLEAVQYAFSGKKRQHSA
jgi:hypothetical protein